MPEPSGGIGRFAPSPTGPLHFGSLLAAVASYLDARCNKAQWLLRIENIDPPREVPGAADAIVRLLEAYGFEWDGPVLWQSDSLAAHEAALARLVDRGLAYACGCSRKDLANQPTSPLGVIYPGTCRHGTHAREVAWRVRTSSAPTQFTDILQGHQSHALEAESGDFVVKRRDGLIAYQLAVVVDDELAGVTRIIRGIDLLESTFRQVWLQELLDYTTPTYAHIPVAVNASGDKLSKLTGAPGLAEHDAVPNLYRALAALGQEPDPALRMADVSDLWNWAMTHWSLAPLVGRSRVSPRGDLA